MKKVILVCSEGLTAAQLGQLRESVNEALSGRGIQALVTNFPVSLQEAEVDETLPVFATNIDPKDLGVP